MIKRKKDVDIRAGGLVRQGDPGSEPCHCTFRELLQKEMADFLFLLASLSSPLQTFFNWLFQLASFLRKFLWPLVLDKYF